MPPSFWPETAEGWLWLLGKMGGFALLVGVTLWRIYAQRLKDLKSIEGAHATEVEARKLLAQELKDESRAREAQRIETKRDLADEAGTRAARDEAQERAMENLREALHVTMGNLTNLTTKVNATEAEALKTVGEIKLDIERGFNTMQQQVTGGFANLLEQVFADRRSGDNR